MYQPQELEVWYIIPAIRKQLAKRMLKRGLKQVEIAEKLGVGESAVSLYLKSKRAAKIKFTKEIKKEIDRAVENILKGKNVVKQIQLLCNKIRKSRLICKISHSLGKMPENCDLCFRGD